MRFFTNVVACAAMFLCAGFFTGLNAQDNAQVVQNVPIADGTVILGYTDAEVDMNTRIGFDDMGESIQLIKLPASMLESHAGKPISALRIAVGENVKDVKVLVRESLRGENLAEQTVAECTTSWNYVKFDNPYVISGDKDLYVGYSYNHSGSQYVIACDRTGYADGACYLGFKGASEDSFEDYSAEMYGFGKLLISAIVGENAEPYGNSLSLLSTDLPEYIQSGAPMNVNISLFNTGWNKITSAVIECDLNGTVTEKTVDFGGEGLNPYSGYNLVWDNFMVNKEGNVKFSVKSLNDGSVENYATLAANSFDYSVYEGEGFDRTLMIEYFTGQSCGFCPQGTQAVEALRFGHEDRIICVTHHSFNYDDFCTEPSLQYYGFFHRTDAMEAPIMMINRTTHHLEFESTEGFQSMDVITADPRWFAYGNNYKNFIDDEVAAPARVSVKVDQAYDEETGELLLAVSGKKSGELAGKRIVLTVFILEDGQVGYQNGQSEEFYTHNNIFRDVVTEYDGDEIAFDEDGYYIMEYSYKIPDKYVSFESNVTTIPSRRNMSVVAFVSRFDDTKTECEVYNATRVGFTPDSYKSVEENIADNGNVTFHAENGSIVASAELSDMAVYSISGARVENKALNGGIYIVKGVDAEGNSVVAKVLVK